VRDIISVLPGDAKLKIEAIGAEKNLFNIEIPMRTVLEQIVAKTNLPPFMFGLSWSTTERLSTHQNDMIVSMIESYRKNWNPIIRKVFDMFLALNGKAGTKWDFEWQAVNLMDEVELANAELLRAQSAEKQIANVTALVGMGWLAPDEAMEQLADSGVIAEKVMKRLGKAEVARRLLEAMKERRAEEAMRRMLMSG
jgi:hypothetical protein